MNILMSRGIAIDDSKFHADHKRSAVSGCADTNQCILSHFLFYCPSGVRTGVRCSFGGSGVAFPLSRKAITEGSSPKPNAQMIVSPTTAGQEFVPPGACHCHTTCPSLRARAYTSPSSVEVN